MVIIAQFFPSIYCFVKDCFDVDHFKSIFIEFLQYCFYALVCQSWGMWELNSLTRDWTCKPPALEGKVLTTGLPRKSLQEFIKMLLQWKLWTRSTSKNTSWSFKSFVWNDKKLSMLWSAISFSLFKKWAYKSIFFMDTHIFMNTHIQENRLNTCEWG